MPCVARHFFSESTGGSGFDFTPPTLHKTRYFSQVKLERIPVDSLMNDLVLDDSPALFRTVSADPA